MIFTAQRLVDIFCIGVAQTTLRQALQSFNAVLRVEKFMDICSNSATLPTAKATK